MLAAVVLACTCSGPLGALVLPADGSTDVPTGAHILVIGDQPAVEVRPAAGGDPLAMGETRWNRVFGGVDEDWVLLAPEQPFAPSTAYVISVGANSVSTFTTGLGADEQPPQFAGLEAIRASFFGADGGSSSCWLTDDGLHQLELDYDELPGDLLLGVVAVRRMGESEPFRTIPVRDRPQNENFPEPRVLSTTWCGPAGPVLVVGETYCATLTAYDGSGNAAGGDAEVCAVAQACAPTMSLRDTCQPVPPEEPPPQSGCTSTRGTEAITALLVVVLFAVKRRRVD